MEHVKDGAGGVKNASRPGWKAERGGTLAAQPYRAGCGDGRWTGMAPSRQRLRTVPSCAVVLATCQTPGLGLVLSAVRDGGLDYLLLQSRLDPGHAMLLPAGAGTPVCGLAAFSRLGRLHARHWALVWGPGAPPPAPVSFSSGDLRFRREATSAAVDLGPVWVAMAEGGFHNATVDPGGPTEQRLALAPSW